MASIQSAVGGLTASILGATLGASHLYQQSDLYKAQSAGRRVSKLNKAFAEEAPGANVAGKTETQLAGLEARGQTAVELRKQAFELAPSRERGEAYERALGEQERLGEAIEGRREEIRKEAEEAARKQFEDEQRAQAAAQYQAGGNPEVEQWETTTPTPSPEEQRKMELAQKASDTIRATILNQNLLNVSANQTMSYNEALQFARENPELMAKIRKGGNK